MEINLKYEDVNIVYLRDFFVSLKGNDMNKIASDMIGFVYGEKNWKEAERVILECLDDERSTVREIAVTCIGHIARIHGKINREAVGKKFANMKKNSQINGKIEDSLDDIDIFVK